MEVLLSIEIGWPSRWVVIINLLKMISSPYNVLRNLRVCCQYTK